MIKRAVVAAALLFGAATSPLGAQTYPVKPLRLIVPFPAGGGGADFVGRLFGLKLAEGLGQPVVVENRPGAAGNIGIELVADMIVIGPTSALQHIQSGKLRALAVLKHERLATLPGVPTIREAGIDNSEVTTWYGVLAPAGTPRSIIQRLNAEWVKSAAQPDTQEKMRAAGMDILSGTPEQFAELMKTELVRWARVVKDANISVE